MFSFDLLTSITGWVRGAIASVLCHPRLKPLERCALHPGFNALFFVLLCSACATSDPVVNTDVKIDFPPAGMIDSVKQADLALEAVALSRAQIEWRYQQKERVCYTQFFTNHCLLQAQEERRIDLAKVKKSEVTANYFKRKKNVEEMDKDLVEKNIAYPLERL
jgi:hypothetical protein